MEEPSPPPMVVSSLEISESNRLTILSYDNSGEIKFDVDIEMEQGYWNTSSSRLWTKIRDLMHDELVEVYKDMRANGVTYENIMYYMYDEQIAKIPQSYFNQDYDIKYAPYADQYLGKAHGDGYQHMKRWLKKRFIFCDTLYDYAPSYNNDVLTIRANTLNEMNLTIETYTPLYQHVSFYNGNMEKIKITPGQPVTFKGFAQTETDQEVLIYGGSNIKKITGIQSMNPNSMLIGGATRLTELDISNCPILTIVNSNKANFSPHTYLNKLNMSNCPQLGGNLNVSNSPLLQEIKARNSAVTGLLLPTSLRNLKTLELPNTISSLALYDASSLDTLKFDEGVEMQSIELSNCAGITNTENFDLTKIPTVILDNSYNTDELYMSETTNLTLRNMSNLERVIYTPNSEYSEFDINNVIGGKNYKVTTNGCPKLTTFMTTAPFRLSYPPIEMVEKQKNVLGDVAGNFTNSSYINSNTGGFGTPSETACACESYIPITPGKEYTFTTNSTHNVVRIVFYKADKSYQKVTNVSHLSDVSLPLTFTAGNDYHYLRFHVATGSGKGLTLSNYSLTTTVREPEIPITPNTAFTANTLDLSATQFTDVKLLCTTDVYNLKVPTTMKNFYCDSAMDIDTDVIEDASYEVIHEELIEPYTTNYEGNVYKYEDVIDNYVAQDPRWDSSKVLYSATIGVTIDEYGFVDNSNGFQRYGGITDFLPCGEGAECTITCTSNASVNVGMAFFDKDKKGLEYHYYDQNTQTCTFTSPSGTAYVVFSSNGCCGLTHTYSVSYPSALTPNIIPSSANGSLIFNMYSNNTTQPTSTSPYMWDLTGLKLNDFHTYGMNNWVKTDDSGNITMPQRMSGYSVRLVNADITPNEYATHLYPKLIDTTLPITGKLDYTAYNGSSLAWAYAYTTRDVNINPLDSRSIGQITNDYNKLYGTDFVDLVDIWVYKDTDTSKLSTNEAITKAYIELTSSNYTTRVAEVLAHYPNCKDLYFFEDGSVTNLNSMMDVSNGSNDHAFQQIETVTFMEDYFDNLTSLSRAFRHCHNLTKVTNIPSNVSNLQEVFMQCSSLTTAPTIPNGVTNMQSTFYGCTSLTTAPNIPSSCTNVGACFNGCTSLKEGAVLHENITAMHQIYAGSSVKKIYVPLANITAYDFMINNLTVNLEDIIWIGERKTDFSIPLLAGNRSVPQADIKELVPEHLADLTALGTTATLTLGETYLSYLTEDEIAQAVAKGWTLQ